MPPFRLQICLGLALAALPLPVSAYPIGENTFSGATANRTCTWCHAAGAAVPTIAIDGPVELAPGATGRYTVTITGGPAVKAGVDVAVTAAGAVLGAGTGTKVQSKEVTQTSPTPFTEGSVEYDFTVTAPTATGPFTIYAAGLSSDGLNTSSGDGTAATTWNVNVTSASGEDAGRADSGSADVGFVDAGTPDADEDAGSVDSGSAGDAGNVDAGEFVSGPDAARDGAQADLGVEPTSGCGCAAASAGGIGPTAALIGLALALANRSRRRD